MTDPIRAAGLLRVAEESTSRGEAVRRAVRRGDVRLLRRGAYVGSDHWTEIDTVQRRMLEIRASVAAARNPVLVSHQSAAVMWGLPVVGAGDERVHLTMRGPSAGVSRGAVARHAVASPLAESLIEGIRVTAAARTVVDLARASGFLTGVAAGDAALRLGLVTVDDLRQEVELAGRGRGVRVARDVVAFVDGRSESPGESLSRVRMRELGIPAPELQHVISDRDGFVGRVDFWWEEFRVIGEFDGRSKYGLDGDIRAAADQLWDEKIREDRLRGTDAKVVRWTWMDAWRAAPMLTRLRQAGLR